ncbi:MAG: MBL fold metallo-hydrolase [Gemmatimonadaceae bacterium]|nr:MBL fold metallo-hydrolase [Gemmatimonadaceae bacterium]
MKLKIFESDMGDCLLLEGDSGELMLCDGGMKASLKGHVRAELSKLRDAGRQLDLVYVSHVDNDHISGILQLLEDEAEWRVFDLHQANGDPIREPRIPRPPVIKGILHNAFRDQVRANNKEIENLLVASAPALYASAVPELIQAADEMQGIAAGIPEALKVSRLVSPDALDIPMNKPPGVADAATLLFAGQPGAEFVLGSMKFTLIGPTKKELASLAKGWNTWLRNNQAEVRTIRAELRQRIDDFSSGALTTSPYDLRDWNGIPDLKGVSAPNVASLMFMVEESGRRLLLTGDGQQDVILEGLKRTGFLDAGFVHIEALKVQHHGSENNMNEDFARRVSADHYVFCGNGSHHNPEIKVIDMVFASRLGKASVRALAPEAQNRDFHFWFSTTSEASPEGLERREIFAEVEEHVAHLETQSEGRLHLHFNNGAFSLLVI